MEGLKHEMSSGDDSTAMWLDALAEGESTAAERLWNDYYEQLVSMARQKLTASRRRVEDEEDLALSVLENFCRAASNGQFPKLSDRDGLWRLLFTIMERKAIRRVAKERRLKRGGGQVRGDSAFVKAGESVNAGMEQAAVARDPSPQEAVELAENVELLLDVLPDEPLRQVASGKLEGLTNDELAVQLDCSPRTIKRHLQRIRTIWLASGDASNQSEVL